MRRLVFFFKQKTAYEMRISDWSSDVCSSDLAYADGDDAQCVYMRRVAVGADQGVGKGHAIAGMNDGRHAFQIDLVHDAVAWWDHIDILERFLGPVDEVKAVIDRKSIV